MVVRWNNWLQPYYRINNGLTLGNLIKHSVSVGKQVELIWTLDSNGKLRATAKLVEEDND